MLNAATKFHQQPTSASKPNASRYLVHMPGCGGELIARCLQEMRDVCAEQIVAGDARQLANLAAVQQLTPVEGNPLMVLRLVVPWRFGEEKQRWAVWSGLEFGQHRLAVIRHPLQAWMSLIARDPSLTQADMPRYFEAYADFAERAHAQSLITYEGLCQHPSLMLRTVCELLDVPYDPSFGKTYLENGKLTGVIGHESADTVHLHHREPPQDLIDYAWSIPAFGRTLEYLGYNGLAG